MKKQGQEDTTGDAKLVGDAVSSKLKAFYSDICSEAVPDRFLELLAKLDSEQGKSDKTS